jgi:2-amino-4-hydroxy-6-hydroxymethyldihydropteridine diphosphokinase
MKRVFLSLGSNLGDRAENLRRALSELSLAGIEVVQVSSFYRTEPVEFHDQPWFVNCVAEVKTSLMPLRLLKALRSLERKLGRNRGMPKGPRAIDLDILFYENAVVRSPALTIPHERMAERRFVLVPLRELVPNLRHPVTQRTIVEMLNTTSDNSHVLRIKAD